MGLGHRSGVGSDPVRRPPGSSRAARKRSGPAHRLGEQRSGHPAGAPAPPASPGYSGSVMGRSSHMSCRKVPMKKDMKVITNTAEGKV